MPDLKNIKNSNTLIFVLGVLAVLVFVNIIVGLQNNGIESVTGNVVEDTADSNNQDYDDLTAEVSRLKDENENLIVEKSDFSKKIDELEAKIKALEEERELEEETCPLPCGVDEICSPINKKDGSVEWQCVDDPEKFV